MMRGRAVQPKGMKLRGRTVPRGLRGTTMSFDKRKRVWSVPGLSPILTPSSERGTCLTRVPVALEIAMRLSSGMVTIAQRPNPTGVLRGLKRRSSSLGVEGEDALQMELLRFSATDWWRRWDSLVGRK